MLNELGDPSIRDSYVENTAVYDSIAEEYERINANPEYWKPELTELAGRLKEKSIVDLGCGTARDETVLSELGVDYTGVDLSEKMLEVAKKNHPQAKFFQGDLRNLQFPDGEFGGFLANASFLHIDKLHIQDVLMEARRVIKEGASGLITVANKLPGKEDGFVKDARYADKERYFVFYTEQEFAEQLERAGFKIDKVVKHPSEEQPYMLCFYVQKIES